MNRMILALAVLAISAPVADMASAQQQTGSRGTQTATSHYFRGENLRAADARFLDQMNDRAATTSEAQRAGQRIANAIGVPCTATAASTIFDDYGHATTGRQRIESYELVCSEGLGWIVTDFQRQEDEAFDCLALATLAGGDPQAMQCKLPENEGYATGLQSVFTDIGVACTVRDAAYLGSGGTPPLLRYEVACEEGGGFILDRPAPGSEGQLATLDRIESEAIDVTCEMTRREVQLGKIRDLAAQSGQACNVVDARSFIAVPGRHLYELSCETGEAYVIEANTQREYVRAFSCAQVASVAGGCRFNRAATGGGA